MNSIPLPHMLTRNNYRRSGWGRKKIDIRCYCRCDDDFLIRFFFFAITLHYELVCATFGPISIEMEAAFFCTSL